MLKHLRYESFSDLIIQLHNQIGIIEYKVLTRSDRKREQICPWLSILDGWDHALKTAETMYRQLVQVTSQFQDDHYLPFELHPLLVRGLS